MRIWRGGGGSSSVEPASAPAPSGLSDGGLGGGGEARAVAVEHLDPREQVMPERDRLRALEVRVAGHQRLRLGLGEGENDEGERVDRLARLGAGVEHVHAKRGDDLVVARAPSVDLAPDLAELPLDRGVDVLVRLEVAVRVLRDLGEARLGLVELLVGQQTGGREPSCVLGGRLAVVRQELGVVGAQEPPHVGIESALDPPCPGGHTSIFARSRAACNSVSSDEIRMKPSAASCGNVSPVP